MVSKPFAAWSTGIHELIELLERGRPVAARDRADLRGDGEREQHVQAPELRRLQPESDAQAIERQLGSGDPRELEAGFDLL
ncbi:MAG: hypothetical protein JWP01_1509 [Myxococcales bacterium]|nr:hypothetical protein [Myxococcales bacterium]